MLRPLFSLVIFGPAAGHAGRLWGLVGALLLAALPTAIPCSAQERPDPAPVPQQAPAAAPWVPSLRTMGRDAVDLVRAPLTLSPDEQLLTLGAAGLVLSAVSTLDRPVYRRLNTRDGSAAAVTAPLAAPGRWYDRVGPDRVALGTAWALAAGGTVLQHRRLTRTSVRVVEALVFTKVATSAAKGFFSRTRPYVRPDPLAATPGEFENDHGELSMPSGHTARAFAVASVLSHSFDRWYVSAPAYGMAASVAMERVRSGDHWLTDVVVGGALGTLIGRSVVDRRSATGNVTYAPILSLRRVGVSVRF